MKVFISWSGALSKKIAELLNKWIPCMIQSVDVFFSPEDIEKGDNWDKTLSTELSDSKYGIICLTKDNINAPWLNFEAGAIAKTLDSKIAILMIDIQPSDIKGPLSRYQATKFEKEDFYQLITSINNALDTPLDTKVLDNTFNTMWVTLEDESKKAIEKHETKGHKTESSKTDNPLNAAIEEILQLLRRQNNLLSDPEALFPIRYLEYVQSRLFEHNSFDERFINEIIEYLWSIVSNAYHSEIYPRDLILLLNLDYLENITRPYSRKTGSIRRLYVKTRDLNFKLKEAGAEEKQAAETLDDDGNLKFN